MDYQIIYNFISVILITALLIINVLIYTGAKNIYYKNVATKDKLESALKELKMVELFLYKKGYEISFHKEKEVELPSLQDQLKTALENQEFLKANAIQKVIDKNNKQNG